MVYTKDDEENGIYKNSSNFGIDINDFTNGVQSTDNNQPHAYVT